MPIDDQHTKRKLFYLAQNCWNLVSKESAPADSCKFFLLQSCSILPRASMRPVSVAVIARNFDGRGHKTSGSLSDFSFSNISLLALLTCILSSKICRQKLREKYSYKIICNRVFFGLLLVFICKQVLWIGIFIVRRTVPQHVLKYSAHNCVLK